MSKKNKITNLDEYRSTKEFTESIESGTLYEELKPKKEKNPPDPKLKKEKS